MRFRVRQGYFEIQNAWLDQILGQVVGPVEATGGIPAEDRPLVLRTAIEVVPLVVDRARPFPVIFSPEDGDATRVHAVSLACAAMCPDADRHVMADLALLFLTFLAFDDVMDGVVGRYRPAELEALAAGCVRAVYGAAPDTRCSPPGPAPELPAPGPAGDPLRQVAGAFGASCARISGYPPAAAHYPFLADWVRRGIEGALREMRWRQAADAPWPSYEVYLRSGAESSFGPVTLAAVLAVLGPVTLRSDRRASLEAAARAAGLCCRLYNDLRSAEREKAEGSPNAVTIVCQEEGLSERDAAVELLRRADAYLVELEELLAGLGEELRRVADSTRRMVRFARHWYLAGELHAFTGQQLSELAGGRRVREPHQPVTGGCPGLQAREESGFPRSGAGEADSPPGEPASATGVPRATSCR